MNRKYIFILVSLMILFSSCEKRITGLVIDDLGRPIEGVSVKIENSEFSSTTGSDGVFKIDYIPGKITINLTKSGYASESINIELAQKENHPLKNITLTKESDYDTTGFTYRRN